MKKKCFVFVLTIPLLLIFSGFFSVVMSQKIRENKPIFYTITVTYDGKDSIGKQSSGGNLLNLKSDTIYVKDKLPEGLIFQGFVANSGVIEAVKQGGDAPCSGYVVDDLKKQDSEYEPNIKNISGKNVYEGNEYKGLSYNNVTNTVEFKINELQAGGEIKVTIVATTPNIDDTNTNDTEKRKDFYNYAEASENDFLVRSNMVYAYIGNDDETLYKLKYILEGSDIPQGAVAPEGQSYAFGEKIVPNSNINVHGYKFDGWSVKSGGVTLSDGSFTMPANDVELVGSFTKLPTYKVSYKIDGDYPSNYIVPKEKNYLENTEVMLDSYLNPGDVIGEYKFLGWKLATNDVSVSNEIFNMPNFDVVIEGKWEKVDDISNPNHNLNFSEFPTDTDISEHKFQEKFKKYEEDVENPQTYDNIYSYVGFMVISGVAIYLIKSKSKGKYFAK